MRRAIVVAGLAVLAALAVAAPASADIPPVHGGSVIGRSLPLKVFGLDQSAGAPVRRRDHREGCGRRRPEGRRARNVHVLVNFAPYTPVARPTVTRSNNGRLLQMTWTWTLRCLTVQCLPQTQSSQFSHVFHFHPARVEYLSPRSAVRYALDARFQRVEVLSQLSPSEIHALGTHTLIWQDRITPVSHPNYRVSPSLVFWLSVALAIVVGAAGLALAARWALQFRPSRAAESTRPSSSLERALTLFFWARAHDDETLQRKALERVADELPFDVHELSETARALAWSPEAPDTEDVEEISQRAGISRHNGDTDL